MPMEGPGVFCASLVAGGGGADACEGGGPGHRSCTLPVAVRHRYRLLRGRGKGAMPVA